MTKEEYVLLYEKCASGNCTEEERRLLEEYMDEFSLEELPGEGTAREVNSEITERIYRRLQESMHADKPSTRWLYPYGLRAAAAVVFMFLCSGLYYYIQARGPVPVAVKSHLKNDIPPGRNAAVLTLSDGSRLVLDNSINGILARQGNAVIRKLKDGQLIYDQSGLSASNGHDHSMTIADNSVSTPRSGEYKLLLPDGTRVWLNAESSLTFPPVFGGSERKVELSGEAYFEVARNEAIPFRVIAGDTEIEVLGTHFNVNAYHEEVKTTLLEGSVRLKRDGQETLLQPGQSGIPSEDGAFTVQEEAVHAEEVVDWKNGYFVFQDENIRTIMERAARWYDVEVEYRGNMEDKNFWGKVSRYENISELLKNLELTGMVRFKIEGRKVIVMP